MRLMTKSLGLFSAASLIAVSAHSQTAIYEPFDYDTGNVSGSNGGTGFAGAWTNTRNNPTVASPGLMWGALVTAGNAARGNAWSGLARPIGSTLSDAGLMNDGATLWFSAVMDLTGQNFTNADLNLALTDSSKFVSGTFGDRQNLEGAASEGIGFSHQGGNVIGAYWQDAGDADTVSERTIASSSYTLGGSNPTTALVVGRIEWGANAGANESLTLYAPGTDLAQGSPILDTMVVPALNQSAFDTVLLQFKDSAQWDEIRFGATYADVAVLPDPLRLEVDTVTGAARLIGGSERAFDINYYQVTSEADSLTTNGWNSLADQDYDGNGPADGSGNGWEEGGSSGPQGIAEAYLLGQSEIPIDAEITLGTIYDTSVDAQDLAFRYRDQLGQTFDGIVEYIASDLPGDTDGDGDIDDSDLGTSFANYTGPVGAAGGKTAAQGDTDGDGDVDDSDLGTSFAGYTGPLSPVSVPEPTSLALVSLGALALVRRRG